MSRTVARFLFNPVFQTRLEQYIEAYKKIVTQVESLLLKRFITVVKDHETNVVEIMEMVQHDFKNAVRRKMLKKQDDRLFLDKTVYNSTILIRHLQLRVLWKHRGPGELTMNDKKQLWDMLSCFWLLAKMPLTLPKQVCDKIEEMAIKRSKEMDDPNFDVAGVQAECEEIINKVKGRHFRQILSFVNEFTFESYTPVVEMLPKEYTNVAGSLHNLIKDDEYRGLIMDTVAPVMHQVQSSAEERGIRLLTDESDNKIAKHPSVPSKEQIKSMIAVEEDEDFDYEDTECAEDEPEAKASDEDKKKVSFVISTIFTVLQKHTADLRMVANNPAALLKVFADPKALRNIGGVLKSDIQSLGA